MPKYAIARYVEGDDLDLTILDSPKHDIVEVAKEFLEKEDIEFMDGDDPVEITGLGDIDEFLANNDLGYINIKLIA